MHFKLQSQAALLLDSASRGPGGHGTQSGVGDSIPLVWSIPGHLPGTTASPDRHCQLLHSPQHWLNPQEADLQHPAAEPRRAALHRRQGWDHFRLSHEVLPVHSPLLEQSRLLALPPLSDMLKFSGSFPVHQVTHSSAVLQPMGAPCTTTAILREREHTATLLLPLLPSCVVWSLAPTGWQRAFHTMVQQHRAHSHCKHLSHLLFCWAAPALITPSQHHHWIASGG